MSESVSLAATFGQTQHHPAPAVTQRRLQHIDIMMPNVAKCHRGLASASATCLASLSLGVPGSVCCSSALACLHGRQDRGDFVGCGNSAGCSYRWSGGSAALVPEKANCDGTGQTASGPLDGDSDDGQSPAASARNLRASATLPQSVALKALVEWCREELAANGTDPLMVFCWRSMDCRKI